MTLHEKFPNRTRTAVRALEDFMHRCIGLVFGAAAVSASAGFAAVPSEHVTTVIVSTEPSQSLGWAIFSVTLFGSDETLKWSQTADARVIHTPKKLPGDIAGVFKITPRF